MSNASSVGDSPGPSVLIISSCKEDVAAYQEAVQSLGLTSSVTESLEEVPSILDASNPGLIILDRMVGEQNAMAALLMWRERPEMEEVPIIVVLEGAEPEDIYAAYDCGGDAALQKPVDVQLLRSVLESMFE